MNCFEVLNMYPIWHSSTAPRFLSELCLRRFVKRSCGDESFLLRYYHNVTRKTQLCQGLYAFPRNSPFRWQVVV